ncbi:hypothetical protein [Pseudomonas phage UF_RH7]|nr:hypothetical protein [Pseudomonas phage UF_RH7]
MPVWAVQVIIAVVMMVASYLLTPRPKTPENKPQVLEAPTVSAGRAIPVPFGRVRVKSPNVLYFGGQRNEEIKR